MGWGLHFIGQGWCHSILKGSYRQLHYFENTCIESIADHSISYSLFPFFEFFKKSELANNCCLFTIMYWSCGVCAGEIWKLLFHLYDNARIWTTSLLFNDEGNIIILVIFRPSKHWKIEKNISNILTFNLGNEANSEASSLAQIGKFF